MSYVVAGYVIVLSVLFLYGAQLVWRRRRLERAMARVIAYETRSTGAGDVEPTSANGMLPLDGTADARRGELP